MRVAALIASLLVASGIGLAHPFEDTRDPNVDHACGSVPDGGGIGLGAHSVSTRDLEVVLNGVSYHVKMYVVTDGEDAGVSPSVFLETNNLADLQEDLVCRDKADPKGAGMNCNARDADPTVCTDHGDQQLI